MHGPPARPSLGGIAFSVFGVGSGRHCERQCLGRGLARAVIGRGIVGGLVAAVVLRLRGRLQTRRLRYQDGWEFVAEITGQTIHVRVRRLRWLQRARDTRAGLAGQTRRPCPRKIGPVGVPIRILRTLHRLRRVLDGDGLPVRHLDQLVVEPVRRIRLVHQLLFRAPPLTGTLLEQSHGIPVAVAQVHQPRLLHRRGDGDGRGMIGQAPFDCRPRDDFGVQCLFNGQHFLVVAGRQRRGTVGVRRPAWFRAGSGPYEAHQSWNRGEQGDGRAQHHRDDDHGPSHAVTRPFPTRNGSCVPCRRQLMPDRRLPITRRD